MKKSIDGVYCVTCGKVKAEDNFYKSYNPIHSNGKVFICKKCISEYVTKKDGSIDINKFKYIMCMLDLPYIYNLYTVALENKVETIGMYFQLLGLKQNRGKAWSDSDLDITEYVLNIQNKYSRLEEEMEEIKKKLIQFLRSKKAILETLIIRGLLYPIFQ